MPRFAITAATSIVAATAAGAAALKLVEHLLEPMAAEHRRARANMTLSQQQAEAARERLRAN